MAISILFWSSAPSIAKICLSTLDTFQVMFFMFLISSLSLFLISLYTGESKIIIKYRMRDYYYFAFMGFIGVFFYFFFLLNSFINTNVQEVYLINYTWPIWMMIFTVVIFRTNISLINILSVLLGFIGMLVVISKNGVFHYSYDNSISYIFGFISAILYGLFSSMGKKDKRNPISSMFFYFLFSFALSTIFLLKYSTIPSFSLFEIIGLSWLGLFSCALGFLFWFKAIQYGNPLDLANFVYLTPIVSLIIIHILLREPFQIQTFVGLSIILLAIFVNKISLSQNRRTKKRISIIKD